MSHSIQRTDEDMQLLYELNAKQSGTILTVGRVLKKETYQGCEILICWSAEVPIKFAQVTYPSGETQADRFTGLSAQIVDKAKRSIDRQMLSNEYGTNYTLDDLAKFCGGDVDWMRSIVDSKNNHHLNTKLKEKYGW